MDIEKLPLAPIDPVEERRAVGNALIFYGIIVVGLIALVVIATMMLMGPSE
jgi:hypothetical protein